MLRGVRAYVLFAAGYFLVLELLLVAAIYWWPTFAENVGTIAKLMKPLPIVSDMTTMVADKGVSAYVVAQHFFKGCSALGTAAGVLFAASAIAGEAHRGTLEIYLARPVSRTRLMTERWIGGLVALVTPVFVSSMTIPWLLESMVEESMGYGDLLRCAVHMSLFLAPIYAITFAWSAFSSNPVKVSFVMLFGSLLVFGQYLVEGATNYSLFRLVDIREFMAIIETGSFKWKIIGPLIAATIGAYFMALACFKRRTP